ncbi:4Fe-4S dicluster domain-containing protein [Magnetospirillum sp. UT-4]|uniref:4Fe-4S dicluster domain-containing protein n=1 Tax=Magnetospirillum sp. UT-4 TaxID=2681467 RepID=UPI001384FE6A|nr:4Fe-4S dicluster domain-containing protein [Magnetospirillum sp. UT-4]CAA7626605.1 putative ferredoxin-type protein essential for electron transfer from ubiquinol to periplasmic nitrate reductase (NapAB) [Magnetospirillum sp. UT-4]
MTAAAVRPPPSPVQLERRRRFLRSVLLGGAAVGAALAGWIPIAIRAEPRLRPPGAIAEDEFLASCIKCGQCVQVCPVKAIELGDITEGFGIGVPHIDARAQACDFSCDAVQCILACPTGALTHAISKKEEVRMGIARLARPDACLARQGAGFKGQARGPSYTGLHRYEKVDRWKPIPVADHPYDLELCDLCVRECPVPEAIRLGPMSDDPADRRRHVEITQTCVGCGMCEMICPVEPAAIVIDARAQWRPA